MHNYKLLILFIFLITECHVYCMQQQIQREPENYQVQKPKKKKENIKQKDKAKKIIILKQALKDETKPEIKPIVKNEQKIEVSKKKLCPICFDPNCPWPESTWPTYMSKLGKFTSYFFTF
ncbi:MAG: hypothetical protein P4L22_04820 [Candidatus Babeliales bacterium]|nr:hypothetical protein [Candidatus Babeliales bacterium]